MKFSASLLLSASLLALEATAAPLTDREYERTLVARVDPNLVPQFGLAAGLNPDGAGNCDGIAGPTGAPIKIPCACPPDRQTYLNSLNADVAAGHMVNNPGIPAVFPTDNSVGSQIVRLQTSIAALQNINGPGVGCPASSTTFSAQLKALTG